LRVFRARLKPGRRAAYETLFRRHALPLMRKAPGNVAIHIGRPQPDRPDDFVLTTVWTDLAALQAYTGANWRDIMVLPGEAELIEQMGVQHFDEAFHPLTEPHFEIAVETLRREQRATRSPRLSDDQWERILPLLPPPAREGRPRADDRRTLDGILYVLRTGSRWRDLPRAYGSHVTCWRRFAEWQASGVWERIWQTFFDTLDMPERLVWAPTLLPGQPVPRQRGRSSQSADGGGSVAQAASQGPRGLWAGSKG